MHFTVLSPCPTVISKIGMLARPQQHRSRAPRRSRGHRSRLQAADRQRIQPVLIPKRQVIQQVLDGLDAALRQRLGDALAHALHILDRSRKFQHRAMLPRSVPPLAITPC